MRKLSDIETKAAELALGRILRLGSRPTQPGDIEQYDKCRNFIMDLLDDGYRSPVSLPPNPGWNFGSRNRGVVE